MVSGSIITGDFWFLIHSPSQEHIEVGQRYKMTVEKTGDGYDIVSQIRQE